MGQFQEIRRIITRRIIMNAKALSVQAVILAAGKSSRFHTSKTKLSFTLCGQEMILHPLKMLHALNIPTTLVLGHQKEALISLVEKSTLPYTWVEQTEQKGTGHALKCTRHLWTESSILVMNGDMPLVTPETLQHLITAHTQKEAVISFVAAHIIDPSSYAYGRVDYTNNKYRIIEPRDFTGNPQDACLINAGIYLIERTFLESAINELASHSNSGELYITDLIENAGERNLPVEMVLAPFDTIRGINTLKELWEAEHIKRSAIIESCMLHGVRFMQPHTVQIDTDVTIGAGSVIDAGAQLLQGTRIGTNTLIGPYSIIKNSIIHDNVTIHAHSVIEDSEIHQHAEAGPFAHIRNTTTIHKKAVIGNFVEISKSVIGENTKAKHLSYLGNALIKEHVNIGAGTITCNYNGITKNTTTIEEFAHIGSNNSLVAPVTIGKHAITGAGSVITDDVPSNALGIARARQVNKEDYARKLRENEAPFIAAIKTETSPTPES